MSKIDFKRLFFIFLGLFLFFVINYAPPFADAIDPKGEHFALTREGKAAIALFLLAGVWWVFEVVPIGITSIGIAVFQALFMIRPAKQAFGDFMDPSVWFIIGSLVIGMTFSKTGLTQRMAYRMLIMVGEKTKMIYFGAFAMIGLMTLIMAHTAVAAAIYPLLMAIYALYKESDTPTKFGKGLFIGMAYSAGAGSIVTLLGSARAIVAIGFFKSFTGREITFLELSYYMLPLGWSMLIIIWLFISTKFKPERATIPGLRQRAISLNSKFGPLTSKEKSTLIIVFSAIAIMGLQAFIPSWQQFNKSAIILIAMLMFFLFKILTIEDLEQLPWNIALLFGGAMSIGYCLWDTGAAKWLAVNWLAIFQNAHWLIFILGIGFFVLIMTNFIMNVAAIAISLPVALVIAPYLGISPEAVFYVSLATAGMPFVLLVGAAPNAIAYESRQFTSGEFFLAGVPMSLILMAILTAFILIIWPLMGMPILN